VLVEACNLSTPTRFHRDASLACPIVYTSTAAAMVDDECDLQPGCRGTITQAGCHLTISYAGCTDLPTDGTIEADGTVHMTGSALTACDGKALPAATDAPAFTIACAEDSPCRIDFYPPPFPTIGTTDRIQVANLPLLFPNTNDQGGSKAFFGYLAGAAILGDQIAVVRTGTASYVPGCPSIPNAEIVFYDRHTLLEVTARRRRAPDCTARITTDPMGRGFFALHGYLDPKISLFDPDRPDPVLTAPVGLPQDRHPYTQTLALVRSQDGSKLYAGYAEVSLAGWIATFDVRDLSPGPVTDVRDGVKGIGLLADKLVAAVPYDATEMQFALPESGLAQGFIPIRPAPPAQATSSSFAIMHLPSSLLVVSVNGDKPTMQVFDGRTFVREAIHYERPGGPWAVTPWPLDPSLFAVGMLAQDHSSISLLARFDPVSGRFLPGTLEVGEGPVESILVDADQNLWLVLPASGMLVRVIPRAR
jgi:hypothetical protein